MKRPETSIIGADVPDQTRLRVREPVKDLDEFLEFLARLEGMFGSTERPRQITTGDHFLL